ncbi:MAG: group II intron reverse transcriptase/maturase [Anaerolineales bacterium]|nr:group II intron reverse transcriptase/maturase [Anaerolineales bacterium]
MSTVSSLWNEQGRQKLSDRETDGQAKQVKPAGLEQSAEPFPTRDNGKSDVRTWEAVFERENMQTALKRVESNKGAAGIDGMKVEDLRDYLKAHWQEVRETLESGKYRPSPVRRVEIPKPDGGVRQLGIPTVIDRMIQQAIAQVLSPMFEEIFSTHSYGFRPRSAHQAVEQSQEYIREGYDWVVDIDLEKFFDRVNHDMLTPALHQTQCGASVARVAREVKDKRVLKLIRAYLNSGVMVNGVVMETEEGTPQGGPLSPLLSNVMLNDLDRELEDRGHRFVRYADDCNIYVKTQTAGERVLESVKRYLEKKLKLKVNPKKSKVERATRAKFLGFSFWRRKGEVFIRIANRTKERFAEKIRHLTKRTRSGEMEELIGQINQYLIGWMGYYRLARTPSVYQGLDKWIRRRLRQMQWKRWKKGATRYREIVKLGVPKGKAALGAVGTSPWRMSHSPVIHEALSNAYWRNLGLESMLERYNKVRYSF